MKSKQFLPFYLALLLFIILPYSKSNAQIEVEPTGALFTPESLISNVFLGEGVEVTNIQYSGTDNAVGYFTNGTADVGIGRGIVMATGLATTAATPNSAGGTTGGTSGPSNDPYLGAIATSDLNDLSRYTISFIPVSDTLRFRYSFASEEYPEWACTTFNDVFGFFIYGPGISGPYTNNAINIALVPEPSDPTGLTFTNVPVSINNVNNEGVGPGGCNYNFANYYNDNSGSNTLTYDAILDVFTAQVVVTPCEEYTIVLAISDVGDAALDSGVFLEAKSFGTGSLEVETATVSLDGTITEGCSDGLLTFSLPSNVEADFPIDYTILGDAVNGVDYEHIPDDLFIPAGQSSVSWPVIAFEDNLVEGVESIGIDVQRDPCNRDTFYFFIRDNTIVPPQLGNDTTVCRLAPVQLDATLPVPLPEPPRFESTTIFEIAQIDNNNPPPPGTPPTISSLNVFGVQPVTLEEGVIKRICIDVNHIWISDVDVFLVSPGGQFMELTTDNGGSGNHYTQTCFTPEASNPIDFGSQAPSSEAPFTGDWQPEGVWEDLWDGENPTNGTWQLQLKDDANGFDGDLLGWSICFNPLYQLRYEWFPEEGLSCTTCPDPIATPDATTTYYVTATDTYGCEVFDSITIEVIEILPPPVINCSNITNNSITFVWDDISGANGYEVSINGGAWITPSGSLEHIAGGLNLNETVTIEVRGLSDCDGEIGTTQCTVPNCNPPSVNVDNITHVNCYGGSDGQLMVTGFGDNPPFTYHIEGIDTTTTGVFNNLLPGSYIINVTGSLGCTGSTQAIVVEPAVIQTQGVLETNASCNGGADGSVSVTASGGVYPYAYSWSVLQNDSLITGLPVGTYYVTVTDANNCSAVDSVSVIEPALLTLVSTVTSVSCNGLTDGSATISASGGLAPYSYLWDNNAGGQITETAINLGAGTYFVTVSDQNGCSQPSAVQVFENQAISLNLTSTNVSCNGLSDGSMLVDANGGAGTFTYAWSNGQILAEAIDLVAGNYIVTVTDIDGCTATISETIIEPDAYFINQQTTNLTCFGSNDGSITLNISGGTLPYSFQWNDGSNIGPNRTDLSGGTHTVTITDAMNCPQVLDISIFEPQEISLLTEIEPVGCNGGTSGSASVIPSGGNGNYSYQWDSATGFQTDSTAINLTAETYIVTVTDSNGCSATTTVDVLQATSIGLTYTTEDVGCFGSTTGTIALAVNGGMEPYNYSWAGPNGFTADLDSIFELSAGTYQVTITDNNNCTFQEIIDILQPLSGISSTMSLPDTICNGFTSGSAIITPTGGSGNYTYAWSNGSMTENVNDLEPGQHYVTVTDAASCFIIDTAVIVERPEITFTLDQTAPLCHDGNDGTAVITDIFYGTQNENINDYGIIWNNNQVAITATNLSGSQTYEVTITHASGCTAISSIIIGNPDEIEATIISTIGVTCNNSNDGRATVSGVGGVGPYTYIWSNNAGGQTSETAVNLFADQYNVTVTDSNGCSTNIDVEIIQPNILKLEFLADDVLCPGEANGQLRSIIDGGLMPYQYLWSTGDITPFIDSITAGNYTLTVTDANGCTIVETENVDAPAVLSASIQRNPISCHNGHDGSFTIIPTGGVPPYTFSTDGLTYNGTNVYIGLSFGTYDIYVKDANDCVFYKDVWMNNPAEFRIEIGDELEMALGDSLQLTATLFNEVGEVELIWGEPYEGTLYCPDSTYSCDAPWSFAQNSLYYSVYAIDENGCEAEDDVRLSITKDRPVFVPTAFTPNGDLTNDLLLVHGKEGSQVLLFRIFDRWGELLYEAGGYPVNESNIGWNGNFRGKKMGSGVYVWYAEIEFIDGQRQSYKGNTTLLR